MNSTDKLRTALLIIKSAGDSSFLGRYLAAGNLDSSILANKQRIMEQIDSTGEYQDNNLILNEDLYKKQRELGYDYLKPYLKRQSAGSPGKAAILSALLGSLLVGGRAALSDLSRKGEVDPVNAALGAGAGGLLGGIVGGGGRMFNRYESNKVTDEDVRRMKAKQKNHSFLGSLIPLRNTYDAITA
jgi:hypothetical protein